MLFSVEIPHEIELHILSFVTEKDLFQTSLVTKEWNKSSGEALRQKKELYMSRIESILEEVFIAPPFKSAKELVRSLEIFQIDLSKLSPRQLRGEIQRIKRLSDAVIVKLDAHVDLGARNFTMKEIEAAHLQKQVNLLQKELHQVSTKILPGSEFMPLNFTANQKNFQDTIPPELFNTTSFVLGWFLPRLFPAEWKLKIGETIALMLRGKILLLTLKKSEVERTHPVSVNTYDYHIPELVCFDLASSNSVREKNSVTYQNKSQIFSLSRSLINSLSYISKSVTSPEFRRVKEDLEVRLSCKIEEFAEKYKMHPCKYDGWGKTFCNMYLEMISCFDKIQTALEKEPTEDSLKPLKDQITLFLIDFYKDKYLLNLFQIYTSSIGRISFEKFILFFDVCEIYRFHCFKNDKKLSTQELERLLERSNLRGVADSLSIETFVSTFLAEQPNA